MRDSLEDRIHRAGKSEEFNKALTTFRTSQRTCGDEQILYDALVGLGADDEEADAFVDLEVGA